MHPKAHQYAPVHKTLLAFNYSTAQDPEWYPPSPKITIFR